MNTALPGTPAILVAQTARGLTAPERVQFPSADGKTMPVGYLFKSSVQPEARVPA